MRHLRTTRLFLFPWLIYLAVGCAAQKYAVSSAQRAAAGEDPQALYFLGKHYESGTGIPKDEQKAVLFMKRAADQGNASAQYELGRYYLNGIGGCSNATQGVFWLHQAAQQGDKYAEFGLGLCYARGQGVETNFIKAMHFYRLAANQNLPQAFVALGEAYQFGAGNLTVDYSEAVQWYQKGASLGDSVCNNNLGFLYEMGYGVPKDSKLAAQHYLSAAQGGINRAFASLGNLYLDGLQLKQDLATAYKWFVVGEMSGDGVARHYIEEMDKREMLSPEEKNRAVKQAETFLESHPYLGLTSQKPF